MKFSTAREGNPANVLLTKEKSSRIFLSVFNKAFILMNLYDLRAGKLQMSNPK